MPVEIPTQKFSWLRQTFVGIIKIVIFFLILMKANIVDIKN